MRLLYSYAELPSASRDRTRRAAARAAACCPQPAGAPPLSSPSIPVPSSPAHSCGAAVMATRCLHCTARRGTRRTSRRRRPLRCTRRSAGRSSTTPPTVPRRCTRCAPARRRGAGCGNMSCLRPRAAGVARWGGLLGAVSQHGPSRALLPAGAGGRGVLLAGRAGSRELGRARIRAVISWQRSHGPARASRASQQSGDARTPHPFLSAESEGVAI